MSSDNKKYIDIAKKLILIAVFSCFVHFWVARAAIVLSVLAFFFLPGINKVAFSHKGSLIIFLFSVIGWIVSLCCKNIYGIASYPMFFAIMYFGFVVRAIATKDFFEKILDTVCMGGCVASAIAFLLQINNDILRSQAGFPNPNFLGAALMIAVFVCIYKVVIEAKNTYLYFIAAAANAFGIILCGSLSLWVVMAIGAAILFTLNRNTNMLIALICAVVLASLVIFFKPELIYRLNEVSLTIENRVNIWKFSLENIKATPIFGRGFFSYRYWREFYAASRADIVSVSLAHNLLLDSLLSHGIVGTGLLSTYVVYYFKDVIRCRKKLKLHKRSRTINSFIIAVCVAIAIYGLIDTTFIWVQSGTLLLMIMCGLGADENNIREIEKSDLS